MNSISTHSTRALFLTPFPLPYMGTFGPFIVYFFFTLEVLFYIDNYHTGLPPLVWMWCLILAPLVRVVHGWDARHIGVCLPYYGGLLIPQILRGALGRLARFGLFGACVDRNDGFPMVDRRTMRRVGNKLHRAYLTWLLGPFWCVCEGEFVLPLLHKTYTLSP